MKKNIARIIALALVAVMACALLAACAPSKPSGTYKCKKINGQTLEEFLTSLAQQGGQTLDEALAEMGWTRADLEDLYSLTFNSDGTGKLKSYTGQTVTIDFTWEMDGDQIAITSSGETTARKLPYKNDTITMETGGYTIVFGK